MAEDLAVNEGNRRLMLALLLLLLLWWLWRRLAQPVGTTTSYVAPPYQAPAQQPNGTDFPTTAPPSSTSQGGGGSFNGFMPGDVGDSALSRLAPESIAMLNSYSFVPSAGSRVSGGPLYDTYVQAMASGDIAKAEEARKQIAIVLGGQPSGYSSYSSAEDARGAAAAAGMRAAAEAANRDGNLASSVVHTEVPQLETASYLTVSPTIAPSAIDRLVEAARRLRR